MKRSGNTYFIDAAGGYQQSVISNGQSLVEFQVTTGEALEGLQAQLVQIGEDMDRLRRGGGNQANATRRNKKLTALIGAFGVPMLLERKTATATTAADIAVNTLAPPAAAAPPLGHVDPVTSTIVAGQHNFLAAQMPVLQGYGLGAGLFASAASTIGTPPTIWANSRGDSSFGLVVTTTLGDSNGTDGTWFSVRSGQPMPLETAPGATVGASTKVFVVPQLIIETNRLGLWSSPADVVVGTDGYAYGKVRLPATLIVGGPFVIGGRFQG